mgnify:CR=1 FL=1
MATARVRRGPFQGAWVLGWDLASGETGDAIECGHLPDKTIQIYGTFATGGVSLEGACDSVAPEWTALRDAAGNAITLITAEYMELCQQNPLLIRAVATTITAVSIRIVATAARMRTA